MRKIFNNTAQLILKPSQSKKHTIPQLQRIVQQFFSKKQNAIVMHHNIDEAWHVVQAE